MRPDSDAVATQLLERDGELEVVGRSIARVRDGAGELLFVDGPAGVGKTTLLHAARTRIAGDDVLLLHARGAELERAFAYGVVRQLLDPVLHDASVDRAAMFAGAARFAAPLLDADVDDAPAKPPEDPFAARHALYWLMVNLAVERPLVLVVDDAHWADKASLDTLAYIANRLEGVPVAVVIAARTEGTYVALEAMRRQAGTSGTLLGLGPLGEAAAAEVVRALAPAADDAAVRACFRASGGNPFLLNELARSIRAGGGSINERALSEQSPERVTREVSARLARLQDDAAAVAKAAAVLGEGVPLRQAALLAGIDHDAAIEAADELVTAGVLGNTQPIEFLHPTLRAAVYDGLGPAARGAAHARAAHLLAEESAPPERVAAQLLICEPTGDQWACDQLVVAARLASARGATDAAARYLHRALDEPPPPEARATILFDAAVAEAMSAEPGAAIEHLHEMLAADLDVDTRASAALLLASLLGHSYYVSDAVDVLEAALGAVAERPDLRRTIEVAITNIGRIDPSTRVRAAPVVERLRRDVAEGTEQDPGVLGTIATEMAMAAEPAERTATLAERALAGFDGVGGGLTDWSSYNAARTMVLSEAYDRAIRILSDAVDAARERGGLLDAGGAYVFRAEAYLRIGDLENAEVDARTLLEISKGYGWPIGQGFAAAWLCEVLTERGDLDDAEYFIEGRATTGPPAALTRDFTAMEVLCARGRLRIAQGRAAEGVDDLCAAKQRAYAIGNITPGVSSWRSYLIDGLLAVGQVAEARREADEQLVLARRMGSPRVTAAALRGVAAADGGDRGIELLRDAVEAIAASPARLECARVHAALGAALRRAGREEDAREPLRTAVDIAHRCGATMLENEALEELRAAGARPRRRAIVGRDALTASERRIAELAASGQQNREIAQALVVTTATIEFHLRNAYRKLGIRGRRELGTALGSQLSSQQVASSLGAR